MTHPFVRVKAILNCVLNNIDIVWQTNVKKVTKQIEYVELNGMVPYYKSFPIIFPPNADLHPVA